VVLPFGAMALVLVDPLSLRWFVAGLLVSLITGWCYHGRPTFAASLGVGALAGFGGGAVQIGAPPLLVFWLGGNNNSVTVRANIMVYFIMQGALSMVMYFFSDLCCAMAGGAYWFHGASDALYRRATYLIIALAALVRLPVFDSLR
jgi:hypothetical protein